MKSAPLPRNALDLKVAAVGGGDGTGDRKPEAGTGGGLGAGFHGAEEGLKDLS